MINLSWFIKFKGDANMTKKGYFLMENGNKIEFELYPNEAPNTVANFEKLANEEFYNGLTFHRVIDGFVSQGGCPTGNGTGSAGYTIDCETEGNPHKHVEGSLSMAHAGKNTGSCQFFIVHEPQPHLNGVHTVFGQVTSGIEHAKAMKNGDVMKEVKVFSE
jgi:peptidyl-prolyl cis-trans isomerase B (cyclophilin B)